jgi:hypothetical protein
MRPGTVETDWREDCPPRHDGNTGVGDLPDPDLQMGLKRSKAF